jgi:CheY-like chemotaxis protein/HPt (histidine-containing phosphotransfer) domain-containing protein
MAPHDANKHEHIIDQFRDEFLTDARERLGSIEAALGGNGRGGGDVGAGAGSLVRVRREVHNLKGMGGSFGFPVISLIAHRLEDYIAELPVLDARQVADATIFIDRMQDIVDAGRDPDDAEARTLVRGLPAHPGFQPGSAEIRNVEVLLVSPSRAVSQIALRTLRSLGFRVTTASSAWEALELAVRARPDLIITSAVMNGVSGIDLSRAFSAMAVTEELPIAVLTSFEKNHPELQRLPSDVAIIRLDKTFEEDLAEVISTFSLA